MLLLMAYVAAGTLLYAALVVLAALTGLAGEKSRVRTGLDMTLDSNFTFDDL